MVNIIHSDIGLVQNKTLKSKISTTALKFCEIFHKFYCDFKQCV